MEAIKSYLDAMFSGIPDTDETRRVKFEMFAGMEEKYLELKSAGKTENEAVGTVISEFGNVDELLAEMGISRVSPSETDDFSLPLMTYTKARDYLDMTAKASLGIGIGVWLILLGVALLVGISSALSSAGILDVSRDAGVVPADLAGIITFFIFLIPALALLIGNGIKISQFEYVSRGAFRLDPSIARAIDEEAQAFRTKFVRGIITGVSLCIGGVLVLFALFVFGEQAASTYGVPLLLFLIGGGVFSFIRVGMTYGAYDALLGRGDYALRNRKAEKVIGVIASVYWPVVTAAFLIWGFVFDGWARSWVIWPIAGIVFGAISGAIGAATEHKYR